jgi:hypothetical protein
VDAPVEIVESLRRWLRRAAWALLFVVLVSSAQMAGWVAACAGWVRLPDVDSASIAGQLSRQPPAVMLTENARSTHRLWAGDFEVVRDAPLTEDELHRIARELRAAGFSRVYEPDDPLPDGTIAQFTVSVTWTHPFLVRSRQVVTWGDAIYGSEIEVVSSHVWVGAGWYALEPEVTRQRWFDRENR